MEYGDVTVIIPTLNEEANIRELIGIILKLYKGVRVIVVDDASTDNTRDFVRILAKRNKEIMLLDRSGKVRGLTASVLDGANLVKTEKMIIIDGDLQHPP